MLKYISSFHYFAYLLSSERLIQLSGNVEKTNNCYYKQYSNERRNKNGLFYIFIKISKVQNFYKKGLTFLYI